MTNGEHDEIEANNPYRGLTPNEAIGRAISEVHDSVNEVKDAAITEIKNAREESTFLSYKTLIIGAMFGVLGSLFVSTTLRWYDANWCFKDSNFYLFIIGLIGLIISLSIIYYKLKTLKNKNNT